MGVVRGTYKEDEIKFIMENHDKLTIAEMAEKLNRTYLSVAHKRRDLGLSPNPKRKKPLRGGFEVSKIDEYRDKFEVGKTYQIKPMRTLDELTENYHSDYRMEFEGKLIKKTNELLVFTRNSYHECIKLTDVVRRAYEITEIEKR